MSSTPNLSHSDIRYDPASVVDPVGRVFWLDNKVYRAIRPEHSDFYATLLAQHDTETLVEHGLVHTEVVKLSLEGYGLILKHDSIPFTSYGVEWMADMLKDAALLVCNLSIKLLEQDLCLKDAHPWNVLFKGTQPFFVDWGSIQPLKRAVKWPYTEFRDFFLMPLLLMSSGRHQLARRLLMSTTKTLTRNEEYRLLLSLISTARLTRFYIADRRLSKLSNDISRDYFEDLRSVIYSIPTVNPNTPWSEYEGVGKRLENIPEEAWPEKVSSVQSVLERCRPATVLDIGCSDGWFSKLAEKSGAAVVGMDIDEPNLTTMYRDGKKKMHSVLPLVVDICAPTQNHGLFGAYAAATERLKAEMVMCLSVTHHLVFKRGASFDGIANQLQAFADKWLLVEFIPADDVHVNKWMNPSFGWYTLEGFERALGKYFPTIQLLPSSPTPRVYLLCER